MFQFISLHSYDDLRKISIKRNVVTDKDNSRNEIWHWTNDKVGVAVQSWLWVRVEFMAWQFNRLERPNGIQLLWVCIPLRPTFYGDLKQSFSSEYHMYHFITLHSCHYLKKIEIEINVVTDENNSRNEIWHWANDEIGVVVQRWLRVQVELMACW